MRNFFVSEGRIYLSEKPIFLEAYKWSDKSIGGPWHTFELSLRNNDKLLGVRPGQFFNLRLPHSDVLLGRPLSISVARYNSSYHMLMLVKGRGTQAIKNDSQARNVELVGPLGNGFPDREPGDKICLVGGGIGIAPMLSACEEHISEDLYVCFKTSPVSFSIRDTSPGYDNYESAFADYISSGEILDLRRDYFDRPVLNLRVATEDGSVGKTGMLDAILTVDTLKEEGYTKVFACGPKPMLKYIRDICREAGVKAYLSLENYMACGVGACLGCSIPTTEGNKRCCKDGPVFDADILDPYFDDDQSVPSVISGKAFKEDIYNPCHWDEATKCEIAGVELQTPTIAASGTFGYGTEYESFYEGEYGKHIGAICSKGLTLEPRSGNPGRRLYETSMGLMNSIGLENPGIPHFIEHELNDMRKIRELHGTKIIANLSGSDTESYVEGAKLLGKTDIDMIELNISCPNVKSGGMAFGMQPDAAAEITAAVKAAISTKPLIVKLTPNAPDLVGVAMAVREAGANVLSLVNTFQALAIDIETGRPIFNNVCAGLSGPAIKPIALRMVYDVAKAMNRFPEEQQTPIIGIGGISTWQDAVEFIMAGATAVQIGTATFPNPLVMYDITEGIRKYMYNHSFDSIEEFRGTLLK